MTYHLSTQPSVQAAINKSSTCNTIEALQAAITEFKEHPLCAPDAMPGRAGAKYDQTMRIMILGKAPAGTEHETRIPFSGPMGQVLREETQIAGHDIETCWITCASYWKAKNNTPNATLLAIARPFLFREIELVRPSVIICLGQKADEALIQKSESITPKAGNVWDFTTPNGITTKVFTTFCHAHIGYGRAERAPEFREHLKKAWEIGAQESCKFAKAA